MPCRPCPRPRTGVAVSGRIVVRLCSASASVRHQRTASTRTTAALAALTGRHDEERPPPRPGIGRRFVVRQGLTFTAGMVLSNALGAVVTFVYTVVITGPTHDRAAQSQLRLNGLVILA